MAEIVIGGGRGAARSAPAMFCNINVNSPLHYDVRMLEGLFTYADAGQPVIVTPFLLMGAMAPVTVPAALAQQTAEVLAGLALVQLVRPGTPCVMGSFLSATDMKSGSPSFGGPESAFGLYASGQMARRFGLPWRSGGGTLTASQTVDFQAGYEAFNTLSAAFLSGANVCWQSAGWLEGGLVTCFEKFVADCELIDLLLHQFDPVDDRRGQPRLRRARRGRPGRALLRHRAHARALPRLLLAAHDRVDRQHRPLAQERVARLRRPLPGPLAGAGRELSSSRPLDDAVEAELVEFVERRARELGDTVNIRRGPIQPARRQAS